MGRLPPDFEHAGREVLEFLRRRFGFGLWMVTRVEGDDCIVLQSVDHSYGIGPGRVFRWADSLCSRMIAGDGPRVAPDTEQVSAYVTAPVSQELPVRAYIGVPLSLPDGTLFGSLCAIDPTGLEPREINERAQQWIEARVAEIVQRPGGRPA